MLLAASMTTPAPDPKLEHLEAVLRTLLHDRRLIIASNRGPLEYHIEDDGSLSSKRGSGGMVTALMAAARFVPATWVAAAMTEGDRRAAEAANGDIVRVPDHEMQLRLVSVPPTTYQ